MESGGRDLSNDDIGFWVWDLEIGFWSGFRIYFGIDVDNINFKFDFRVWDMNVIFFRVQGLKSNHFRVKLRS